MGRLRFHVGSLSKNAPRTSEDLNSLLRSHSSSKTLMHPSAPTRPVKYAYRRRPGLIPVGKLTDPNSHRRNGHRSFVHRPARVKPAWVPNIRSEYMPLIPGPGRRSSQSRSLLPVSKPGSTVVENTT